jgi:hypothetical protein
MDACKYVKLMTRGNRSFLFIITDYLPLGCLRDKHFLYFCPNDVPKKSLQNEMFIMLPLFLVYRTTFVLHCLQMSYL